MTGAVASGLRIWNEGAVRHLQLSRPEKRNALNRKLADALTAAVLEADADPAVRVLAISGAGKDFCAGADLAALEQLLAGGREAHEEDARSLGRVFVALREARVPSVAVVRGRALAGGAGLATACDMVVAHEDARFGYPEVRIGFVPAMVMTMLRRAVGEKVAFDLVGTGRVVGAREAQSLGLVSRVLPDSGFDAQVADVLTALAQSPPGAMALTRRLLYDLDGQGFREGIEMGVRTNVDARMTEEFRSGVAGFLAGRDGDSRK